MINRRLPTPSKACHIPTVAPNPIRPQINDRRLGRALDIETKSTSVKRMVENNTFASGAPRSRMRRSVKRTSEPSSPCVNAANRVDSPATNQPGSPIPEDRQAMRGRRHRSVMARPTQPQPGNGPMSSGTCVSTDASRFPTTSRVRRGGVSEQEQNRTRSDSPATSGRESLRPVAARSSGPPSGMTSGFETCAGAAEHEQNRVASVRSVTMTRLAVPDESGLQLAAAEASIYKRASPPVAAARP